MTHIDSNGDALAECRTCHDPHYQKQKNYKSTDSDNLYLATGTITNCVDNGNGTSTLTYSSITYKTGWDATKLIGKTDTCRRTIIFPNVGKLGYSYPVTGINELDKEITVKGNVTPVYQYISSSTFAIMYGQFIRDNINGRAVKFFDKTGPNSYGDGDATYDGVCEICHTQTEHFRNDGGAPDQNHANVGGAGGTNCIYCHNHVDGLDHTGGSGTGCEGCHGKDADNGGAGTTVSHSTHMENDADDLKGPHITCGDCHDTSNYPLFKEELQICGGDYYKEITIQSSQVEADLTDFPMLYNTTDPDLRTIENGGHVTSANGYDIVFADAAGHQLDHEIEKYDASTGELVAWVRIPSLSSSTDTVISIHYGDSNVTTSQENIPGVWDTNYSGVWHLDEDPSGAAPQMLDSTSNAKHGTSGGTMTAGDQVPGWIVGSLDLDGTDDRISTALNIDQASSLLGVTMEAWVQPTSTSSGRHQLLSSDNNGYDWSLLREGATWYVFTGENSRTTGFNVELDWQHVAVTFIPGTGVKFYKNGEEVLISYISYDGSDYNFAIGQNPDNTEYFAGWVDEARVSSTARSAGWIKTSYNNQNSPSAFYYVDNEVAGSGSLFSDNTSQPLATTTACDKCHSSGGALDGVAMAKANWAGGIYEADGVTLKAGNEQWCATCHDGRPANSKADGSGVNAPDVAGDNVVYGFYKTGHNMNCLSCHDAGKAHIDHDHRTYQSALDNYQAGYRLKSVNGQEPMVIPRTRRDPVAFWQDFALCFSCHNRDWMLGDTSHTNFYNSGSGYGNSHLVHLDMNPQYDSDRNGSNESAASCVTCHNVHGPPNRTMVRNGSLYSSYGTTDKVPGFSFSYLVSGTVIDASATVEESTGGRMSGNTGLCGWCHGAGISYTRTPVLVTSPQADPEFTPSDGTTEVLLTVLLRNETVTNVAVDLSSICGNVDQQMYDDGTHGDVTAGDHVYSFQTTVPSDCGVASGLKGLVITADVDGGTVNGEIRLVVIEPGEIVWDNGGADSNWSTAENWYPDGVPEAGDAVAFYPANIPDCNADEVNNNLSSITLKAGYNGTLTLNPDFVGGSNELTLTGNLTVTAGTIVCEGDPTAINDASGGTEENPHGTGIVINAANVTVASGAKINADFEGFTPSEGPGQGGNGNSSSGAGHGGKGGPSNIAAGGLAYDSVTQPTALGSGGGNYAADSGGAGGGAIKINATGGTVTINGSISANGGDYTGGRAGGGSGGSIWIIADTLAGTGAITSNGGGGDPYYAGGGAGGRIALDYTTKTFNGLISAAGGSAKNLTYDGHDGTLSMDFNGHDLTVDGSFALAPGTYNIPNLIVTNNATLSCQGDISTDSIAGNDPIQGIEINDGSGVTINATNVTINSGAKISASYLGFSQGEGPGEGGDGNSSSGGGYGERGGDSNVQAGGLAYGSVTQPTSLGSGGGSNGSYPGGVGGGAVKINATGTVTINGSISANGGDYTGGRAGGGSGGSVWIIADTLAGTGAISANGGTGDDYYAGGGAGGRIALDYATKTYSGTIGAAGGTTDKSADYHGGNGTVSMDYDGYDLTVSSSFALAPGTYNIPNLTVTNNATLQCQSDNDGDPANGSGVIINATNVTIDAGAKISGDGTGFRKGAGPGAGQWAPMSLGSSGGGYGGRGGETSTEKVVDGGSIYGSVEEPLAIGSGAGLYSDGGGNGGGAIKINATGTVAVNGTISVNGSMGTVGRSGGGSGGSIWIIADTLTGSGVISATGGAGNGPTYGGGGGGGRIALDYTTRTFNGEINLSGGSGANNGHHGTLKVNDNTDLTVEYSMALAPGTYNIPNLTVTNGATLECQSDNDGDPVNGAGVIINAVNVTVDEGARISADKLGFPRSEGPGAGEDHDAAAGGGHGGAGGNNYNDTAIGGAAYGSTAAPTSLGSGGGNDIGQEYGIGCDGGGAIKIVASGTVTVDGAISANGEGGGYREGGGGAGGSIWITTDTITGTGTITANGGDSNNGSYSGGGGGGRVAVYYNTDSSSLFGSTTVSGGTGVNNGDPGTIVW